MSKMTIHGSEYPIPPYKRIDRYCDLLIAIEQEKDLFAPDSPLQLTPAERKDMFRALDGNIYRLHYICRYVLLRLDAYRTESGASYDRRPDAIKHSDKYSANDRYFHRERETCLYAQQVSVAVESQEQTSLFLAQWRSTNHNSDQYVYRAE